MNCPRCHEGKLFSNKSFLPLGELHKMPDHCSSCGLKFNPEPGFYTGAMYVSYAINVALFIAAFFTMIIALDMDIIPFLVGYGAVLLVLSPLVFRYSRVLYLYLFYSYEPKAKQEYLKSMHLYKNG